jgi:hypothetical protein
MVDGLEDKATIQTEEEDENGRDRIVEGKEAARDEEGKCRIQGGRVNSRTKLGWTPPKDFVAKKGQGKSCNHRRGGGGDKEFKWRDKR